MSTVFGSLQSDQKTYYSESRGFYGAGSWSPPPSFTSEEASALAKQGGGTIITGNQVWNVKPSQEFYTKEVGKAVGEEVTPTGQKGIQGNQITSEVFVGKTSGKVYEYNPSTSVITGYGVVGGDQLGGRLQVNARGYPITFSEGVTSKVGGEAGLRRIMLENYFQRNQEIEKGIKEMALKMDWNTNPLAMLNYAVFYDPFGLRGSTAATAVRMAGGTKEQAIMAAFEAGPVSYFREQYYDQKGFIARNVLSGAFYGLASASGISNAAGKGMDLLFKGMTTYQTAEFVKNPSLEKAVNILSNVGIYAGIKTASALIGAGGIGASIRGVTKWSAAEFNKPNIKFTSESKGTAAMDTYEDLDFNLNKALFTKGRAGYDVTQTGTRERFWGVQKQRIFLKGFGESEVLPQVMGKKWGQAETVQPSFVYTKTTTFGRFANEGITTPTSFADTTFWSTPTSPITPKVLTTEGKGEFGLKLGQGSIQYSGSTGEKLMNIGSVSNAYVLEGFNVRSGYFKTFGTSNIVESISVQPNTVFQSYGTGKSFEDYLKGVTIKEVRGELPAGTMGRMNVGTNTMTLDIQRMEEAVSSDLRQGTNFAYGFKDIRSLKENIVRHEILHKLYPEGASAIDVGYSQKTEAIASNYKFGKVGKITFGNFKQEEFIFTKSTVFSTGKSLVYTGKGWAEAGSFADTTTIYAKSPMLASASGGGKGTLTVFKTDNTLGGLLGGGGTPTIKFGDMGGSSLYKVSSASLWKPLYASRTRMYEETNHASYPATAKLSSSLMTGLNLTTTKTAQGLKLGTSERLGSMTNFATLENVATGSATATSIKLGMLRLSSQGLGLKQSTLASNLLNLTTSNVTPVITTAGFNLFGGRGFNPFGNRRKGRKPRKLEMIGTKVSGSPLSDLLSFTVTEAAQLRLGLNVKGTHPSGKVASRYFFSSAGFRVPTTQLISGFGKRIRGLKL